MFGMYRHRTLLLEARYRRRAPGRSIDVALVMKMAINSSILFFNLSLLVTTTLSTLLIIGSARDWLIADGPYQVITNNRASVSWASSS